MNRRDRRAAAARGGPSSEARQRGPAEPAAVGTPTGSPAPAAAGKPSRMLRLVARILLSRWLLARVKNPEVERLLISVAMEAGRVEVADELIRRQTMRAR